MNEYDFLQIINPSQLLDEINTASLPNPNYISTNGTQVQIFYTSSLTTDQQTSLTNIVNNHIANFGYITLYVQNQINTLVGYLNNPNMTIANTARAIMVANIAPRLPIDLLTTINTQIHSTTGI